jgi:two-component system, LytTR family, response regulator AlgR
MNILIVDDEPLARARLVELLKEAPDAVVVGQAEHGQRALELLANGQVDVVLLDIRMPVMDGIEAALHMLHLPRAPAVIFCTAYDEHALKAFEANAIDYLLKPVKRERLTAALTRARQIMGSSKPTLQPEAQTSGASTLAPALDGEALRQLHLETHKTGRTQLSARVRGELRLIPIKDVLYLLADTKYVEVHTARETVLIEDSLVQLEEEFAQRLVRIHRSCLVAKSAISGLSRSPLGEVAITLRDRTEKLEVSRRNVAAVRKLLKEL